LEQSFRIILLISCYEIDKPLADAVRINISVYSLPLVVTIGTTLCWSSTAVIKFATALLLPINQSISHEF